MKALLPPTLLHLVALLVAVVAVYFAGLSGSFFFDDRPSILDNPSLRLFDGSLSSLLAASASQVASPWGRPVSMASFALNLHFFGPSPFSFKLVNLLIHLANGVLIFGLARGLLARTVSNDRASSAALWVAAVWLLHPLNLTPVLFVVQRMTSLAALFTLAALNLYLYGRQASGNRRWAALAAAALICWPLGVLSKETALLLPLFVLTCEWLAPDGLRSVSRRLLALAAIAAGLAACWLLAANWDLVNAGYRFRDFSLGERLMTQARVLWFYILQLLLPLPNWFGMYHDDIPISRGLLDPAQTLLAIAGWAALAGYAIYRARTMPLMLFALIWFFAAHMLESTILPLEMAYEHRNYLASFGILVWLADLLFGRDERQTGKLPRLAIGIGLLVVCAGVTFGRAVAWGDEYRRTAAEVAFHPNSARANHDAAVALMDKTFLSPQGGSELAYRAVQTYLQRAEDLNRNGKSALLALLYLDCVAGKPKNAAIYAQLRERFARIPFAPGDRGVIHSLSELLVEKRLCLDDAEVDSLLKAALSNPSAVGTVRGMLYAVAMDYAIAKLKSLPLALEYARAAVQSDPGSVPLRINLVHLLMAAGDRAAARTELSVLSSRPIPPQHRAAVHRLDMRLKN